MGWLEEQEKRYKIWLNRGGDPSAGSFAWNPPTETTARQQPQTSPMGSFMQGRSNILSNLSQGFGATGAFQARPGTQVGGAGMTGWSGHAGKSGFSARGVPQQWGVQQGVSQMAQAGRGQAAQGGQRQMAYGGRGAGGDVSRGMSGMAFPRQQETAAYPLSTMSPQNMQALNQVLGITGGESPMGGEGPAPVDIEPVIAAMEDQMRTQFQQQVLPALEHRMAMAGATDSSAFVREASGLERQLEETLASQAAQMRYESAQFNAQQQLQQWLHQTTSGNQMLQTAMQAAGLPMFGYAVVPGTTGAEALGNYGQGYAQGYQRYV